MHHLLRLTLFILVFQSAYTLAKKEQSITLKQIVEINRVASVKVSPDGKYIAYTKIVPRDIYTDEDGQSFIELHVTDPAGHSRRFIGGKIRLGRISWGPNSQFIYFIAQRFNDVHVNIYRIAIDGGEAEKIVQAVSDISAFTINHDASAITYLAKPKPDKLTQSLRTNGFNAEVYEESLKNTAAYLVDMEHRTLPHIRLSIKQHILSIQYHPKNNQLLVGLAPTSNTDDAYVAAQYHIYDQNGKLVKALKTSGKLGMAGWSNDGKHIAFIGSEGINDPAIGRLFIAETKSGKITESVKGYPGQIKGLQWLSDDQLAFLGHVGTKSEISVLNLDSQLVTSMLGAGDEIISYIHADRSGEVIVATASSDSHPREIMKFSSGHLIQLTDSNPWLKNIKMPRQKTITYQSRDGVELQGILVYPTKFKRRKRYPLLMMVHGGPENHFSDGWLDRYTRPIKYAADQGFVIFLPNYRGSTGRGVPFSKMGQADYAGKEFNDLVDAITHLSKIGLIDKKRVGITGGSYGGYASAWAATALSEHFAASVMFIGISDLVSKFGTTDIPKELYNVHARKYPWDNWQWMLERSPIYHSDKANTPILILHGKEDKRVNPGQSMELYRYIKTRTDTPVRLVFYPEEGHGNKKNAAQLDYAMRLMRWMEFYLKGKSKGEKKPKFELDHAKSIDNKKFDKKK